MFTKKLKTWLISALSFIFFVLAGFACGFWNILDTSAKESETVEESTQAYLLNIDRETQGQWYNGESAVNPENRYYGKDGFFWVLEKCYPDGQPVTDVEQFNDTTVNSLANRVEYPSYVSSITSNIVGLGDQPHGYWNNEQISAAGTVKKQTTNNTANHLYFKRLLPYDPTVMDVAHTATWFSTEDIVYDIAFNDNEWHKVSFYLSYTYANQNLYAETDIYILDTDGNVVNKVHFTDANVGGWVTFAIKGSFSFRYVMNGTSGFQMIAFDKFEERDTLGTKNLTASRQDAQTIDLSWENLSNDSVTNIYRREKGETFWTLLATTEIGENTYTDSETNVASEYEYMLSSGTIYKDETKNYYGWLRTPTIFDGNLPDEENSIVFATAPYDLTKIEFDKSYYSFDGIEDWTATVTVSVQDRTTKEYKPYSGAVVDFSLDGDFVYTNIKGEPIPNMNTDLGTYTADENGVIEFVCTSEYPGEYILRAYLAPVADADNAEYGTAKTSAEVSVFNAEEVTVQVPYLQHITDAIKPGDTVSISGNNISIDNDFKVAYAKNKGTAPLEFDENNVPNDVEYLYIDDLLVTDDTYESGIMFIFPANKEAGSYDFWIKNNNGWSNGITLNAARPLYINQDMAYAGIPVEIVGRNFLVSDFGVGTKEDSLQTVKVKLSAVNGTAQYVVPVLQGVRYSAENSVTGDDVMDSHSYRLTFTTPEVAYYGEYMIYVAADGEDFRLLDSPQTLNIQQKLNNQWDTALFGAMTTSNHIGNDPLDLRVGWAQYLNYANIKTMTPNNEPGAAMVDIAGVTRLTSEIQTAINDLASSGGGVVYFPKGTYYINGIELKEKVFLLGDGVDKTKIFCVNTGTMGSWIRQSSTASNVGVARIGFELYQYSTHNPDFAINFSVDNGGVANNNVSLKETQNKFITDCSFTFRWEMSFTVNDVRTNCRALISMSAEKNVLYQNNMVEGCCTGLYNAYHNDYAIIRNSYVHMDGDAQTFSATGNYTFIENVYLESNYKGHGFALRNNAYISDCYITKTGTEYDSSNIGEMIMFEPPGGYFSTGYILDADERSFTIAARDNATLVRENTRLDYNNFAIYISEGKGAGQLRYFKFTPTNSYGNTYELLDTEKDWDIIPDSTSVFSIICPMEGATVYNIHATDCKKAIFLYNNMYDAVVAECNLWDTEGISVFAGDNNDQRFLPAREIRIENNRIDGVSRLTGKGGICIKTERSGARASNGAQMMNIVVRGNVLTNTRVADGTTLYGKDENGNPYYIGNSETCDMHGISVATGSTTGQSTSGDARFIIIEGNFVDNSEYGVYCDNRITGIIIRNNDIGRTDVGQDVTFYAPNGLNILANHTLYVNGEVSELSGEYAYNAELPTLAEQDGKVFYGWSLTEEYDATAGVTLQGLDANTTLYALYGCQVTFDLNYNKSNGSSVFNTIKVMDGYTIEDVMLEYGDPFRLGYTFDGWYMDKACANAFDASQAIHSNMTVYAKWIDNNAVDGTGTTDNQENEPESNLGLILGLSIGGVVVLASVATTVIIVLRKKKKQ